MNLLEALILGIVQGLTEFLPISSTAHLRITEILLQYPPKEMGAPFTAVIQLGTLIAVLYYFRNDLASTLVGTFREMRSHRGRQTKETKLFWAIAAGTVPIVIFGLLFQSEIENQLRSVQVIAYTLIGLALLLGLADYVSAKQRGIESVRLRDGVVVGLFQALSLIPGASRSGCTITGSLFLGFDRETAARFSFLLSIPSILLAGVYQLISHFDGIRALGFAELLVATFAAFVVGYLSIDFLLKFLRTKSTLIFVIYRIVLGLLLLTVLQDSMALR